MLKTLIRTIIMMMFAATGSILIITGFATPAAAQSCSFSTTGLNFGTVNISNGARVRTSGTFTANCNGWPNQTVRVCANFGSGTGWNGPSGDPRYMVNGATRLNYNIFKNGGYNRIWGSNLWPYPPSAKSFRVRLNSSGVGSKTIPVRGEIYANQAGTPPGLYLSSFSSGHTLIAYAYSWYQNCNTISSYGGVQVPFNVQANIVSACTVTATDMNFGSVGIINTNVDASNTISVQCSNGTPYTIGLDGGLSGVSNPALRRMTNGAAEVTYGIYQNAARTIPWGDTIGTNTISNIGNGTTQNFTAYGRVQAQTTPVPGTYTDTIVVTMTY